MTIIRTKLLNDDAYLDFNMIVCFVKYQLAKPLEEDLRDQIYSFYYDNADVIPRLSMFEKILNPDRVIKRLATLKKSESNQGLISKIEAIFK